MTKFGRWLKLHVYIHGMCVMLLTAFLLQPTASLAADPVKGSFLVTNYSPNEYGAGTQNWEMVQDTEGRMYIANRDGILSFDGQVWRLIELPISTPLRSLAIDNDDRIFVGAVGQFGYLAADSVGSL